VVQTLHNFRLLCPNALLFRDGRVCEDCLGRSVPWPGVVHQCYRGSLAASTGVTTMLAAHRALGTWRKAVDVYVALTEHGRQRFIAGGLPARKIVVKPHFVHPDPGPGTGTGGYAVFVGRLSAEKGLETLLAAWKELGGAVPLRIVGDGPLTAMVQQAAARNAGIRWLGRKTPAEVRELLGGAMFLVFPSHCYETFGLALVEAFARGTPVLASNLGAMAELVGHGRTGLCFQPGNSADLAAKARDLLAGPTALQRMRQAAREEYERKYTAERNYRALLSIYEQALGSPRLRGPTAIAGQHSAEEPQRLPGGRT
jgi:glycosyltransferase involved in cell wall biosynthesis